MADSIANYVVAQPQFRRNQMLFLVHLLTVRAPQVDPTLTEIGNSESTVPFARIFRLLDAPRYSVPPQLGGVRSGSR